MGEFIFNQIIEAYNTDVVFNFETNEEIKNIDKAIKEYSELLSNKDIRDNHKSYIDEKLLNYSDEFQKIKEVEFNESIEKTLSKTLEQAIDKKISKVDDRVTTLSDTVNEIILSSME